MEILPKLLHKMHIQCSENLKEEYSNYFISSICFHHAYFVPWTWLKNEKKLQEKKVLFLKKVGSLHLPPMKNFA